MTPARRDKLRTAIHRIAANVEFVARHPDVKTREALVERMSDEELTNVLQNVEFIVDEAMGTDS